MALTPEQAIKFRLDDDKLRADEIEKAIDENLQAIYTGGVYTNTWPDKIPSSVISILIDRYTGWKLYATFLPEQRNGTYTKITLEPKPEIKSTGWPDNMTMEEYREKHDGR